MTKEILAALITMVGSSIAPMSTPGDQLHIKEWVCTVQSENGIRCDNTTDYCVKLVERRKAWSERIFGCGIPTNKNHPCVFSDGDPIYDKTGQNPNTSELEMFRWNTAKCGPTGVGAYSLD